MCVSNEDLTLGLRVIPVGHGVALDLSHHSIFGALGACTDGKGVTGDYGYPVRHDVGLRCAECCHWSRQPQLLK